MNPNNVHSFFVWFYWVSLNCNWKTMMCKTSLWAHQFSYDFQCPRGATANCRINPKDACRLYIILVLKYNWTAELRWPFCDPETLHEIQGTQHAHNHGINIEVLNPNLNLAYYWWVHKWSLMHPPIAHATYCVYTRKSDYYLNYNLYPTCTA